MLPIQEFTLPNGLRVLFQQDSDISSTVVNILYKVGSKNETITRTGFAHLFEHLMFEGSEDIASFDTPLQQVGGSNNAFTSTDITNYYIHLPADSLDTALWLESNRMKGLAFSEEKLRIQKGVVIEEFTQNYLNAPYGDVFHELRDLVYETHPYKWPTIGLTPQHVEESTLEEVKSFFQNHYHPTNATMVIVGPQDLDEIRDRVSHWFGAIPKQSGQAYELVADTNPPRERTVQKAVPMPLSMLAWKVPSCFDKEYRALELFAELLGGGKSSILHRDFVDTGKLTDAFAGLTNEVDHGLLYVPLFLRDVSEREACLQEVQEAIQDYVDGDAIFQDWEKAKTQWLMDWEILQMNPLKRAQLIANHAAHDHLTEWALLPAEIEASRWEDAKPIVQAYLNANNCFKLHYNPIENPVTPA